MSIAWNPATDFAAFADAVEAVTLTASGGSQTAVTAALRLRITDKEAAASGGQYTQRDVKWHLGADEVAAPPAIGATIIDGDGREWTILRVDHDTRSSRWRCWCRILSLAGGGVGAASDDPSAVLASRVNIQRSTWTKDDHGAAKASWSDWRVNLPTSIQPQETVVVIEHARRTVHRTHRFSFAESIAVDHTHRIVRPSTGETFAIRSIESPKRIDALFAIVAVLE